jgi:hypothetical protein
MGGIPEHLRKPSDAPSATTINSETEGQSATPHLAQKDEVMEEQISEQVILEVKNDAHVSRIPCDVRSEREIIIAHEECS